jgi:hypothetical protein
MLEVVCLPAFICAASAALTWAMARISDEERAASALRPRSRPYGTTLPESLTKH